MPPEQRRLRARIAANARWSRPMAREDQATAARAAILARLEQQVDPNGSMTPEQRASLVRSVGRRLGAELNAARAQACNDRAVSAPALLGPAAHPGLGPPAAKAIAAPAFPAIGRKTVWLGEAGQGSRTKLVVDAYMSTLIEGVTEALELASRLGIDPGALDEVIEGGPLAAPIADAKLYKMRSGDFAAEFPLEWALKDVDLALAAADGDRLPLLDSLSGQWRQAVETGHGREDISPPAWPWELEVAPPAAARATAATTSPWKRCQPPRARTQCQLREPEHPEPDLVLVTLMNSGRRDRDQRDAAYAAARRNHQDRVMLTHQDEPQAWVVRSTASRAEGEGR